MVNKQYTVQKQQHHQQQQQHQPNSVKHYSPPPVRNSSVISNMPNPVGTMVTQAEESTDFREVKDKRAVASSADERKTGKKNTYGRNITLDNKIFGGEDRIGGGKLKEEQQQRFVLKDHMEINDIGRFQYILQMDKEMGTHPDCNLYRVPSRIQIPTTPSLRPSSSTVSTTSINSTNNHFSFWKAGSESPMTTSASDSSAYRKCFLEIYRHFKYFWKYIKWPFLVILCALFLGTSIFLLVSDRRTNTTESSSSNYSISEELFDNGIDAHVIQDNSISFNETTENSQLEELEDLAFEDELNPSADASTETGQDATTGSPKPLRTNLQFDHNSSTRTTASPSRNTQIIQILTKSGFKFDDELIATTERLKEANYDSNVDTIEPTKDSFETIGFTSGHQNNFGIPIEEDERILKILSAGFGTENEKSTTDATVNHLRVSPTLPVITHRDESTTEHMTSIAADIGHCQSTSLSICRGILQYDLTVNRSRQPLSPLEHEHFKYLFESKCSSRAAEFVCSALEPECRPSQMGTLRPCKRICKSILEPCASIIASSEVLTTTFDCDSYPDSSDRNVCEDPTRRGRCFDNEFKCLDSTCIPLQWKCDNIKDCSLGEDEDNCLFCEHEEFRCQSNDKCIPDKWRCDQYSDCPDGSDELDCYDYEDMAENTENERNPREFAFASVQAPDSPKNKPYLTISADEEQFDDDEGHDETDGFLPSAVGDEESQPNDASEDNEEIQKGEASGRVVIGVPKNIANFQDSKEIMMTSDSETDFKYSKINQTKRSTTASTTSSTTTTTSTSTTVRTDHLTPGPNQCPDSELRCISGKCISVEQICDKTIDCPDGADEAMCVYKD